MDEFYLILPDGTRLSDGQIGRYDDKHILVWLPESSISFEDAFRLFNDPDRIKTLNFFNQRYLLAIYKDYDQMESFRYDRRKGQYSIGMYGENATYDEHPDQPTDISEQSPDD